MIVLNVYISFRQQRSEEMPAEEEGNEQQLEGGGTDGLKIVMMKCEKRRGREGWKPTLHSCWEKMVITKCTKCCQKEENKRQMKEKKSQLAITFLFIMSPSREHSLLQACELFLLERGLSRKYLLLVGFKSRFSCCIRRWKRGK